VKVPPGFAFEDHGTSLLVAREDVADELVPLLTTPPWESQELFKSARWLQGRGPIPVLPLKDGRHVILRTYRHGGLLRGLTRDLFVGFLPRPFRELTVSYAARERGVLTPPVLGAAVYPVLGPIYRGVIAVEEIPEARDGLSVLEQAAELSVRQRRQLFRTLLKAAGKTVALAHKAGLVHTDLNVKNLVVTAEPLSVFILDLDRGRLEPGPLSDRQRRSQLKRLRRSLDKVTKNYHLPSLTNSEVRFFLKSYGDNAKRSLREIHELLGGWC
jgi:tRNA A-37 threonylcarbamoyl transferase component Bud32